MIGVWKPAIQHQFGAAIDMLENAIVACPEDLWKDRSRKTELWYLVYHTLFFLDLYLSDSADGFAPPPPFNLDELDPAGIMPPRVYTKAELLEYLGHARRKMRARIGSLTDETAGGHCGFTWRSVTDLTVFELLLYNMRHVQHAAAQMNLALRQAVDSAPRWVARGKD